MTLFSALKVAKEPDNADAQAKLDSLNDLRINIRMAEQFYANNDYQGAIDAITPVIEVRPRKTKTKQA